MSDKILTANRLRDGLVVYLAASNAWTTLLPEAAVARDEATELHLLEAGAQAVAARDVVDPYLIEIVDESGRLRPARLREAIRAKGPTVETRHAGAAAR